MAPPLLSIVVPAYNEETNLRPLFDKLEAVLQPITADYEIVVVNDGSTDHTLSILYDIQGRDPHLVVVDLARNFGKEIAMTAGIELASGQAVVPIDADLQDPPELIASFVAKWQEGYEVVYGVRTERQGETWFKRLSAGAFYRFINHISDTPIPCDTGDYRLLDRRVVEVLKRMPERARFMKGLFAWVGFRQIGVPFERPARFHGRTKWSYLRLWRFALNGIFSFSVAPLKVCTLLGSVLGALSIGYMLYLFVRTLVHGVDVPGYASLMVVVLFMGGIQLLGIGILGEYIARIFDEAKQRPLYVIREIRGAAGQVQ
jgi:polyisoprenyl-phosphate glycosyltransferase